MLAATHHEQGFNPFDPIQDTERCVNSIIGTFGKAVSTHSIRYRILKDVAQVAQAQREYEFQPIRSDTGY